MWPATEAAPRHGWPPGGWRRRGPRRSGRGSSRWTRPCAHRNPRTVNKIDKSRVVHLPAIQRDRILSARIYPCGRIVVHGVRTGTDPIPQVRAPDGPCRPAPAMAGPAAPPGLPTGGLAAARIRTTSGARGAAGNRPGLRTGRKKAGAQPRSPGGKSASAAAHRPPAVLRHSETEAPGLVAGGGAVRPEPDGLGTEPVAPALSAVRVLVPGGHRLSGHRSRRPGGGLAPTTGSAGCRTC